MAEETRSFGIDLGTSYCCIGTWKNNTVELIPNDMGERTTPSYVAFTDTERLIGTQAKNQCARNPQNTIFNIMKLIGRKYDDFVLQSNMKQWPFKIVKVSENRPAIQVIYKEQQKTFFPEEILSMILIYLQRTAAIWMGSSVNNVVIAVPVHFNDLQKAAVKIAGNIAGLNVLRIVATSTLAAVAYCVEDKRYVNLDAVRNQLFVDIGSGTVSVSLVSSDDGICEVKGVAGNINLGGDDFTGVLIDYFVKEFKQKHKMDCTKSYRAMIRLQTQCERAKYTLSAAARANIEIDSLYNGIDFESSIKRITFDALCMEYFKQCLKSINQIFTDIESSKWRMKITKSHIDEIIFIGGSSRIPTLRNMIKQLFGGQALCTRIHFDEPVTYGAAVQAAILCKSSDGIKNILLLDVTSFSLGIHDANGQFAALISRNSTIPCKKISVFSNYQANQTEITIQIYEEIAENEQVRIYQGIRDCLNGLRDPELTEVLVETVISYIGVLDRHLCSSKMNISPQPEGQSKIEVCFDLDANGHLTVIASDKNATGNTAQIDVELDKSQFSDKELQIMIENANQWKLEDERIRETMEARCELENYVYQMRNTLDDHNINDSIKDDDRHKIQDATTKMIDWIDANPTATKEEFHVKHKELKEFCMSIIHQK